MKRLIIKILSAALIMGALAVHAAEGEVTEGFVDDFAPDYWNVEPFFGQSYGTVNFSLDNTELNIVGPEYVGNQSPFISTDGAEYMGLYAPGNPGLTTAGTLTFDWEFNSGVSLDAAAAFWATGFEGYQVLPNASGGPGAIASGHYAIALGVGDRFGFALISESLPADKLKASFKVTQFTFTPVPEPATMVAGVLTLAFCGFYAWRRRRRTMGVTAAMGLLLLGNGAMNGAPQVNGLFYGDKDFNQYPSTPYAQSANGSKLFVRLVDGILYVALVVDRSFNDNVFDATRNSPYLASAGWAGGNNMTARRRMDSEFATFTLTVGAGVGAQTWTWQQGYCGQTGYPAGFGDRALPNWISGTTVSGGLGTPPPSYTAGSSLAWNLNSYATGPNAWTMPGNDNAPPNDWTAEWKSPWLNAGKGVENGEDPTTVIDPNEGYPAIGQITFSPTYNWEWSMIYEWSVDFTDTAFGGIGAAPIYVVTGSSHHSPSKLGPQDDPLDPLDPSPLRDFGDLPESYPTLLVNNGARHIIDPQGAYLGASLDNELDGFPDEKALGDDPDGSDDEDGVQLLTPLIPGQTAVVRVTVGSAGYLSSFIDWDGNGTLDPVALVSATGPTALAPGTIGDMAVAAGTYDMTISVPANATGLMPSRWRITNLAGQGGNSPTGEASSGEVEDHIFLASIGNRVWLDENDDGLLNNGETGIDGVEVRLFQQGQVPEVDPPYATTTTVTAGPDAGIYNFVDLLPGTYFVYIPSPPVSAPLSSTTTVTSDNQTDNDDNGSQSGGFGTPVTSPVISLAPGETDNTVDFGFVPLMSVGNRVWLDNGDGGGVANDGIQNGGEAGIPGVTLQLKDENGNVVGTTTTDGNGYYRFDNVPAGNNYTVFIPPANFETGGPLFGMWSSEGTYSGDMTDKGVDAMNPNQWGIVSTSFDLGPGLQPTGESDGAHGPSGDAYDNLTIDFGLQSSKSTLALLKSIRGFWEAGQARVEWVTASEVGTLGFSLYRRNAGGDWELVNAELVLGVNLITGGTYSATDACVLEPGKYTYKLIELTEDGQENLVGVYEVTLDPTPRITRIVRQGGRIRLYWTGGNPPYRLMKQTLDNTWIEVPLQDATATSVEITTEDPMALFQIRSGP